ncbi:ESPR domain-containing protein [Paraburkholderia solitsugae]|uniref:ESPR domain-containing protein n=1 Tax=Paraburkholderia solitsugae TaxID=2675748 RepID=UPI001F19ED53|nr:ESPR domain-containing protein [Paraburkholderia solitsugae]
MNKSYKSVWNESTGTYVAASEVTKSRGKASVSKKADDRHVGGGLWRVIGSLGYRSRDAGR